MIARIYLPLEISRVALNDKHTRCRPAGPAVEDDDVGHTILCSSWWFKRTTAAKVKSCVEPQSECDLGEKALGKGARRNSLLLLEVCARPYMCTCVYVCGERWPAGGRRGNGIRCTFYIYTRGTGESIFIYTISCCFWYDAEKCLAREDRLEVPICTLSTNSI